MLHITKITLIVAMIVGIPGVGFGAEIKLPDQTGIGVFPAFRSNEWSIPISGPSAPLRVELQPVEPSWIPSVYSATATYISSIHSDGYKFRVYLEGNGGRVCFNEVVTLPVTVTSCSGYSKLRVLLSLAAGSFPVTASNIRYVYGYDGVILNGLVPDILKLGVAFNIVTPGKIHSSPAYGGITVSYTASSAWGTNQTGVSAARQVVSCSTSVVGEWSKCDSLSVTHSTGSQISLAARLQVPPRDCEVRAEGISLTDQPSSIVTSPFTSRIVEEYTKDIVMEVKCSVPGKYQIPITLERRHK
ncbi:Uncharacterised protein [Yersinia ruckeri]|nr:Uncharacterised protein [Yersinia ruckeri]